MGLFNNKETNQRINLHGERIENLSKWIKELTRSIDNLKKRDEIKSQKIDTLESSYDILKEKIEEYQQTNEKLEERNLTLNHELDSYIEELNRSNENHKDLVKTLLKQNKDVIDCLEHVNNCLIYDYDLEESSEVERLHLEDEAE